MFDAASSFVHTRRGTFDVFDRDMLEAVILGIVQGITEFLPISSDGHLVLVQDLLRRTIGTTGSRSDLHYDVVLHLGTLGAIVLVYYRELLQLPRRPWLCAMVVLACVPAGVAGLLFKDQMEQTFKSPLAAGLGLWCTAVLLWIGTMRLGRGEQLDLSGVGIRESLLVGVFQALAILPGVSRSGSTIAMGLMSGLRRDTAATFSFLMAVPVISGACLLILKDLSEGAEHAGRVDVMVVGVVTSFVVGVAALKGLLKVLSAGKLHYFAWYCAIMGTVAVIWQLTLWSPPAP